jgi:hypothetical protein
MTTLHLLQVRILRGYVVSCMSLASHRMTVILDIVVSQHADHRPVHVSTLSQSCSPVLLPMINVADLYHCSGMDMIMT